MENTDQIFELSQVRSAIESLIFISNKPLLIEDIKKLFDDIDASKIRQIVEELKNEYQQRLSGISIIEIAGGFQMVTSAANAGHVKSFYKIKHTEKLSGPSLETLAIIAYKQPVTKVDIEALRGVNVDGVIKNLLEKNLIRIVGRKEVIGRPFVYGTTRLFLDYFGLKSLDELPKIEEFTQQDLAKHVTLASGEGSITPLTDEEVISLQQGPQELIAQAAPQEENDEPK